MTSIAQIRKEVCEAHGIALDQIKSPCRYKEVVHARSELCYRLKNELGLSYPRIGAYLNRDHTSIMQSVKRWPYFKENPYRPSHGTLMARKRKVGDKNQIKILNPSRSVGPQSVRASSNRFTAIDAQISRALRYGQHTKAMALKNRRELVRSGVLA